MTGKAQNKGFDVFCHWCGKNEVYNTDQQSRICRSCNQDQQVKEVHLTITGVKIGMCSNCSIITFDTWFYCISCGANHRVAMAKENIIEKQKVEILQVRKQMKEMAKAAYKRKKESTPKPSSSKSMKLEEFDVETDHDLGLLDESLLSQKSYNTDTESSDKKAASDEDNSENGD